MAKQKPFPDIAVLGNVARLRGLLAAAPDIHERDADGRTALFRVGRLGQIEKALLLLEAGADPNATDALGEAPLQSAARYGHIACVEALLKAGAAIDYCPPSSKTEYSESALYSAARKSPEAAKLLLAHGADPNAATDAKRYPLFAAIRQRNAELVVLLLQQKASVSVRDSHDRTALHIAMERQEPSLVTLLLDHGADPDARNDRGETPIFAGIAKGENGLATVQALLAARPDLSIKDKIFKEIPLKQAIRCGVTEIATALRNAGSPSAPPEPDEDEESTITIELTEEDLAAAESLENAEPDWREAIEPVEEDALAPTAQDKEWAAQVDHEAPSLLAVFRPGVSEPHWELLRHAQTPMPLTRMAYFARRYRNAPAGRELEDGPKVLGESYEAAAERFVEQGFLKRLTGAPALLLAFSQAELSAIAKQNRVKVAGLKAELAERLFSVLGEAPFEERLRALGGYFELTPSGAQEAYEFEGDRGVIEAQQRKEVISALLARDFLRAAKAARVLALLNHSGLQMQPRTEPERLAQARFICSRQMPAMLRFNSSLSPSYVAIAAANVLFHGSGDDWQSWEPSIEPPKTEQGEPVKLYVISAALRGYFV